MRRAKANVEQPGVLTKGSECLRKATFPRDAPGVREAERRSPWGSRPCYARRLPKPDYEGAVTFAFDTPRQDHATVCGVPQRSHGHRAGPHG